MSALDVLDHLVLQEQKDIQQISVLINKVRDMRAVIASVPPTAAFGTHGMLMFFDSVINDLETFREREKVELDQERQLLMRIRTQ